MPKNTDFFKLGPYSRKNSIRTRTRTKIGQTESNRAKTASPRAREGSSRRPHARPLSRNRGSAGPVRLGSARLAFAVRLGLQATRVIVSLELRCSSQRSTCVRGLSPPSAASRPTFFFSLSSLSSEIHNTVPFSVFHIFRFVDRIYMISSAKF